MMATAEIKSKFIELIEEYTWRNPCDIEGEHNLVTDLGFDSLDLVEILMDTEEAFDLEISDSDAEELTLKTVDDCVTKLELLIN